jgi:hypothetical protein
LVELGLGLGFGFGDFSVELDLKFPSQISCFPLHVQIPATTDDSDFEGTEFVLCHEHGKPIERHVAFEGILTGRRFLACAVKVWAKFVLIGCCGLIIWSLFSTDFVVSRSGLLVRLFKYVLNAYWLSEVIVYM